MANVNDLTNEITLSEEDIASINNFKYLKEDICMQMSCCERCPFVGRCFTLDGLLDDLDTLINKQCREDRAL